MADDSVCRNTWFSPKHTIPACDMCFRRRTWLWRETASEHSTASAPGRSITAPVTRTPTLMTSHFLSPDKTLALQVHWELNYMY